MVSYIFKMFLYAQINIITAADGDIPTAHLLQKVTSTYLLLYIYPAGEWPNHLRHLKNLPNSGSWERWGLMSHMQDFSIMVGQGPHQHGSEIRRNICWMKQNWGDGLDCSRNSSEWAFQPSHELCASYPRQEKVVLSFFILHIII